MTTLHLVDRLRGRREDAPPAPAPEDADADRGADPREARASAEPVAVVRGPASAPPPAAAPPAEHITVPTPASASDAAIADATVPPPAAPGPAIPGTASPAPSPSPAPAPAPPPPGLAEVPTELVSAPLNTPVVSAPSTPLPDEDASEEADGTTSSDSAADLSTPAAPEAPARRRRRRRRVPPPTPTPNETDKPEENSDDKPEEKPEEKQFWLDDVGNLHSRLPDGRVVLIDWTRTSRALRASLMRIPANRMLPTRLVHTNSTSESSVTPAVRSIHSAPLTPPSMRERVLIAYEVVNN
jgi:hypothetical protein